MRPQFRDYSNVPLPEPGTVMVPPAAKPAPDAQEAAGRAVKSAQDGRGAGVAAKPATQGAQEAAASAAKSAPESAKPEAAPPRRSGADNVIDLSAKAAARPGGKRR